MIIYIMNFLWENEYKSSKLGTQLKQKKACATSTRTSQDSASETSVEYHMLMLPSSVPGWEYQAPSRGLNSRINWSVFPVIGMA